MEGRYPCPDWAKGAVAYQIYIDRFRNGNPASDVLDHEYRYLDGPVRRIRDWNTPPTSFDVRNFYGGDLAGVREKLDYLKDLGVEVLYLNPLFVSPSNHKYDTQDYDHIDPHLTGFVRDEGALLAEDAADNEKADRYRIRTTDPKNLTAADQAFADFVSEAHDKGIRVILDGVFNHCGSFHRWFNKEGIYQKEDGYPRGAYEDAESPFRPFFSFGEEAWPNNETYQAWWEMKTLPKLNYDSEGLRKEILAIAKKWVSPPFNCDGWRLDVAADLGNSEEENHAFWKDFREAVREANPDAFVFAEHYGDPSPWLSKGEWDSVMNFDAFMDPVSYYLTGMEKHSDCFREDLYANGEAFFEAMEKGAEAFPEDALLCAVNQLDNHDHSRFLTRTNRKVGRVGELGSEAASEGILVPVLRCAVVMQMTWPGAPTLYYGDEAGLVGFTDPDNRRTYPWGSEDADLLSFYKAAIRLHKEHAVLRFGKIKKLFADGAVIGYLRSDGDSEIAVIVNAGKETGVISHPGLDGSAELLLYTEEAAGWSSAGHSDGPRPLRNEQGELCLPPHAAGVWNLRGGKT